VAVSKSARKTSHAAGDRKAFAVLTSAAAPAHAGNAEAEAFVAEARFDRIPSGPSDRGFAFAIETANTAVS
jgi:hypothetical protein